MKIEQRKYYITNFGDIVYIADKIPFKCVNGIEYIAVVQRAFFSLYTLSAVLSGFIPRIALAIYNNEGICQDSQSHNNDIYREATDKEIELSIK